MDLTLAIIVTVVGASTPILIAALGELVVDPDLSRYIL